MPLVRVEPLADDRRDRCAALLAERHARHRPRKPLLPACDDFAAQPPASRFWPRRGFRPQFFRLYRAVP